MIQTDTFFKSIEKLNVLIVGDVMIDRYLTGNVNRISPEAPVPVIHLQTNENRLGGAANVALNIKALGANPILCSTIGKDSNGKQFLDLLPEHQLSTKGIIQSEDRETTVKTRIIASNQHILRVDREQTNDLNEAESSSLLKRIRQILDDKEIHVILFQDYNKGVLSYDIIREIILEAIKRDIPTAVDPKFNNFWAYKHVTLFKPNLKEIRSQLESKIDPSLKSLTSAAQLVTSKLGNTYTLITLSEKGIFLDGNGASHLYGTTPRSIADVCGAGDTVISIAALGLALKTDMKEVAILANLAGGQVCEKVGVVPVDRAQLMEEHKSLKASPALNGMLKE